MIIHNVNTTGATVQKVTDASEQVHELINVREDKSREQNGRFALQLKTAKAANRANKKLAQLEARRQRIIEDNRAYSIAHGDNPDNADMLWA